LISDQIYKNNGIVHFRGKFNPILQRDYQLVPGVEFLAMLVPHINLKHEIVIRYYGALSTTIRKKLGWIKPAGITTPPIVSFSEAAEKFNDPFSGQLPPGQSPGSEDHQDKVAQEEADSEFIKGRSDRIGSSDGRKGPGTRDTCREAGMRVGARSGRP